MRKFLYKNNILDLNGYFNSKGLYAGFISKLYGNPGFKNPSRKKVLNEIFNALNLDIKNAAFQNQMHTSNVAVITKGSKFVGKIDKEDVIQNNDAMITNEKNIIITAWGADCTPVYFYDKENKVIALAHSGREGTKKNIVKNVIEKLINRYSSNPKYIIAVLGPGICGNCYQINNKIATEFESEFIFENDKGIFLDIKKKIKRQLNEMGIKIVADTNICTKCDERFYSYRREGKGHGSGLAYMVLI